MEKLIEKTFGQYYYNKFSEQVREQKDCILLLLDMLDIILLPKSSDIQKGKIVVKIDKMSRIFCFLENKYFSIVFPFTIFYNKEKQIAIYDSISDMTIDNRIIALLKSIVLESDIKNDSIEDIMYKTYWNMTEDGYSHSEIDKCFALIMRMISSELGYIRYDYDEKHNNGNYHPLNHLDINCSSRITYKIGLKNNISHEEFIDILNVKSECKYLI